MTIQHITKEKLADYVERDLTGASRLSSSPIPMLAFDNERRELACPVDECSCEIVDARFNLAAAAGYDEVVYEWNPDLERLYVKAKGCSNCGFLHIVLHENGLDSDGDVIRHTDGGYL